MPGSYIPLIFFSPVSLPLPVLEARNAIKSKLARRHLLIYFLRHSDVRIAVRSSNPSKITVFRRIERSGLLRRTNSGARCLAKRFHHALNGACPDKPTGYLIVAGILFLTADGQLINSSQSAACCRQHRDHTMS